MKIDLDQIQIDEAAFEQTKLACNQEIKGREKKYNLSKGYAMITIIVRDCRFFLLLCIFIALLTYAASTYATIANYDGLLLFQTGSLILLSLLYLLKDQHIHMQELAYPTLIGSSKLFLYKMSACMLIEVIIVVIFTMYGINEFQYPVLQLLLVGIVPIFLLHAIAIQIAGRCSSLKVVVVTLVLLYLLYFSMYFILKYQQQLTSLFPYVIGIVCISILYDCISMHNFNKQLCKEGGYIQWN